MSALVELDNVSFGYHGKLALQDVSLQIHAGQSATLVGPSGAGKTSLLKLVLGMLSPTRGEVRVGGRSAQRSGVQAAYVPQLETVDWSFPVTVEEAVLMGRSRRSWIWPWPSGDDRRRVREVLGELEILHLRKHHIANLSGGQQQRVFLARALIAEPELLVLDEPTTGVDMRAAENVLHLLAHLNRQGMTILMTTHDLNSAAAHSPWVICLNQHLIAEGPPGEIFTDEILSETYESDMMVLRQGGMIFVHQRPHDHTLEDLLQEPLPMRSAS